MDAMCAWQPAFHDCFDTPKGSGKIAMAKEGNGNFFMSGVSGCSDADSCGRTYFNAASPLFHMPSKDEEAG